MKNVVSIVVFAVVFLALGAMALMAAPGGTDLVAEFNPSETAGSAPQAGSPELASAAASLSYSSVAMPLSVSQATADDVASYMESFCDTACPGAVAQVMLWNANSQVWSVREVGDPFSSNPSVGGGDSLAMFVGVDSTWNGGQTDTFAWVGDVPEQGAVVNSPLFADGWNYVMIPLDQTGQWTMNADTLAGQIGGVTKVGIWNASSQVWSIREVSDPFSTNPSVTPGYGYFVFTGGPNPPTQWP